MNVYKVYDDSWETIMGPEQLRGFVFDQVRDMLCTSTKKEVDTVIDDYMSKENRKLAKTLLRKFEKDSTVLENVSEEFLIDLLKTRAFEVKTLEVC